MPNRNTDLTVYLAKVETTEGTDPAPDGINNAIEIAENFDPDNDFAFKPASENRVGGHLHPEDPMLMAGPMISGQQRKLWLRGNPTFASAGSPIESHPWFISSGHSATYDATPGLEKVTYTPADSNLGTMTEYYYRDGMLYKFTGCRSEITFSFEVGAPAQLVASVSGRLASQADATLISPTLRTNEWPIATDMTVFTIDGYTAGIIRSWEHTLGNQINLRPGVKAQAGIQNWRLARRDPTWKIVLEEPLFSEKDFRSLMVNKTPIAISWLLGGTTYGRFDFSAARAFIRKITPSNDNTLALVTLEGVLRGNVLYTLAVR